MLAAFKAGPKDLLEFCTLHFGMNAISIPRMLSSLPETLLLHSCGKASAPHFPPLASLSTQFCSSGLPSSPHYLPSSFRISPRHPSTLTSDPHEPPKARNLGIIFVPDLFFPPTCPSHYYCSVSSVCTSGSLLPIQPLTAPTQPKPSCRHTSLTSRRPSHSLVSTSGPWKSPPCSPGGPQPG